MPASGVYVTVPADCPRRLFRPLVREPRWIVKTRVAAVHVTRDSVAAVEPENVEVDST
jgi:hypothetical protein